MPLTLRITTPERVVFEADNVEAVYAPSTDGEIGILPRHIPLVIPLKVGVLRYVQGGNPKSVAVMGGLLRTDGESVAILSDAAELSAEINTQRAQTARERAEQALKSHRESASDVAVDDAQLALQRAIARLKACQK